MTEAKFPKIVFSFLLGPIIRAVQEIKAKKLNKFFGTVFWIRYVKYPSVRQSEEMEKSWLGLDGGVSQPSLSLTHPSSSPSLRSGHRADTDWRRGERCCGGRVLPPLLVFCKVF